MPPKALPARKKNGQFTAQAGQPPSSLATPPASRLSSQNPPADSESHTAPRSRSDSVSSSTTSPVRSGLADLIDPSSDSDHALTFAASGHSRSASPTIPAPSRSRSTSPVTSDFPTSLDSSQPTDSQDQTPDPRFIIPAGFETSLQFLPTLVSRPRPTGSTQTRPRPRSSRPPTQPVPNLPPPPASQTPHNLSSHLPLPSTNMSHATTAGCAAMPSAQSSKCCTSLV